MRSSINSTGRNDDGPGDARDSWFASPRNRSWLVVGIGICLLPLVVIAVRAAIRSNLNDVSDWLPAHYEETAQYRWFRENFGHEDFVVVSWPGCTLNDPRLERLATRLTERSKELEQQGSGALVSRVTTGRGLIEQLTSDPIGLSEGQAVERLEGTLIGPDGLQTCAAVVLADRERLSLREVLREIHSAAVDVGVPSADVRMGGPPVVNDALDRASSASLVRLAGLAALVGLAIAWASFREVRLTAIVFIIAAYSAALSLAVLPLLGVPLNAILITMVPLVYVAAMSGAIHLSNYYQEGLHRGDTESAIANAVRNAALPLGLAAVTTAIGLLSLWYSDLSPIRLFGVFSALGVVIGLAMQLIALPALLRVWPDRGVVARVAAEPDEYGSIEPPATLSPRWREVAAHVPRNYQWYSLAFVVLLAAGVAGLSHIETSIRIMRLFDPGTPIISNYAWLEKNVGAMVPMEIVIRFDESNRQRTLQRLQLIQQLHETIDGIPGVSGCLSAATFTPNVAAAGRSIRSVVADVRLKNARPQLVDAGYLRADGEDESWRISVRTTEGDEVEGGDFEREMRRRIDPILDLQAKRGVKGVSAMYTGAVPIIYKARRGLLDGLMMGFATDVLLVVIAVVALMRSWASGLLLMLTSVFPMAIVFGLMGWCGWPVDIGSMMTPCVALGVTIDDAIHYVMWYGRGASQGLDQRKSVELAYAVCGRAMIQSWGVIGVGLSVFALSTFVPTFRFGVLIVALLSVALVCNLVFLPALLAGPLGRYLTRRTRIRPAPVPEHASPVA